MPAELTRLDLRLRRRSTLGYTAGIAIYALVIVALYPSFENDTSLNKFTSDSSTIAALFGATGSITSPSGWLNANLYTNFVPLVMLLVTIGYGASCIAGQDEDGTLGMVATLPVSRRSIATQKIAAMALQAAPVAVVTALCIVIGRWFDLTIGGESLIGVTTGVVLLGVAFGSLALLIATTTGTRGIALGVASAFAASSYLISSLAPVVSWLRPARYASLFFYAVGDGQLEHGLNVPDLAVLAIVTATLSASAVLSFDRLDIR
ncbi:MAG: ABC transporter permease subunit [Acidimicrobiales bacterium]